MARRLTLSLLVGSLLAGLVATACGGSRLAIEYDYDGDAKFDGLKTWSWLRFEKSGTGSGEVDTIIREALAARLERMGYRQVAEDSDFQVGYVLETRRRTQRRYIDTRYGYQQESYYFNGVGGVEVDVIDYLEGSLILDVATKDGKSPIWRGWAEGAIREGMSESKVRAELTEAIRQIMEKFPPPATRKKAKQ
ncbi:MAG: DUF4136 domain-containing protein [Planctomycetota bacterium]